MDNSPPSRPKNLGGPRQKPQRTQVFSPDTSACHLSIVIDMCGLPTDGIGLPIVLAATSVDRRFGGSSQASNALDCVTTLHCLVSNAMSEDGHTLHFYSFLICLLWVNHALAIQPRRRSLSVAVQSHLKWCVAANAVMCQEAISIYLLPPSPFAREIKMPTDASRTPVAPEPTVTLIVCEDFSDC